MVFLVVGVARADKELVGVEPQEVDVGQCVGPPGVQHSRADGKRAEQRGNELTESVWALAGARGRMRQNEQT